MKKVAGIDGRFLMKSRFGILGVLALVALAGVVLLRGVTGPPDPANQASKAFVIPRGASASLVANRLEERGLIANSLAFKLAVILSGVDKKIAAGEYFLSPSMRLYQTIEKLLEGPEDVWVTIPEGLRREEVAAILEKSLTGFNKEEFLSLTKNLEGRLFPDTYLISKEATPAATLNTFSSNFIKRAGEVDERTLIIASLVEREVRTDEDRKLVAGIIIKRLNNDWPLDIDATLQYAKQNSEDWWAPITVADKEIKSPYNTYRSLGLPPSPICSPGLASIEAAKNPVESEYWFYLSDSDGVTRFARTLEEHQENIRIYLQ